MDPLAREAERRGLLLIGDLLVRGLTVDTLRAWSAVPAAAPLLRGVDLDDAAEAHTRVVLLEAPPFESAFCSADGLVGGEVAEDVLRLRRATGLGERESEAVDHLGEELGWVGFLVGAEADAARDGVAAPHVTDGLRAALDRHLLRWLPAWAAALGDVPRAGAAGLYPLAADLAVDLAVRIRARLGGAPAAWALPDAVDVLADPGAGLAAVARHLCLPAQAGGYLAPATIVRVGRALDLPAAFGSRADRLEGLLRSAAQYDRVDGLVAALDSIWAGWDARWAAVDAAGLPTLAAPWRARISSARAVLGRLAAARSDHDADRVP